MIERTVNGLDTDLSRQELKVVALCDSECLALDASGHRPKWTSPIRNCPSNFQVALHILKPSPDRKKTSKSTSRAIIPKEPMRMSQHPRAFVPVECPRLGIVALTLSNNRVFTLNPVFRPGGQEYRL